MELAISAVRTQLAQDTSLCDRTCVTADEVTTLLSFCLNATYCVFVGQFFKQSFGTAMGLPVSVMVANLVMEDLEECALLTYTNPSRYCKRYVNDRCTSFSPNEVPSFHPQLNSIKPRIQFTIEHEQDRGFPS